MAKRLFTYLFRLIWIPTELVGALLFLLFIYVLYHAQIDLPPHPTIEVGERKQVGKNHYVLGSSYLKKNEHGIWEMYLEGDAYERGLIYGKLAKELVQRQEDIFVGEINKFLPNKIWRHVIKLMVGFFNSEIPNYIPLENQQEIAGISASFSDEYNYIASKYTRILNYHAAHDIGHALNDYSMVGCTSFAVNGEKSEDKQLLLGRNFDFYIGDEFAEDKLLLFMKPKTGYGFVSYSWAGFTGVASGMNEKGLTVTINASKSDLPTGSKMPISLLAREILQYAKNINEAIAIAKKRHTFVSETLMIGSAADQKAILIEKSPSKLGIYETSTNELVCSNHYQSKEFAKTKVNQENIKSSDSKFRFERMKQLLDASQTLNPNKAATLLRDQFGLNGDTLGMGNPRAINQLLAHHSVVMQPVKRLIYVSTNNYQLGAYLGYDLQTIFKTKQIVVADSIAADNFVNSTKYQSYNRFNKTKKAISAYLMFDAPLQLTVKDVQAFIDENGESYVTYEQLGKYFQKKKNPRMAAHYFKIALTKPLASEAVRKELQTLLNSCHSN
jgi:predicted choloylglycine hydrolase